jgi:serine/threonine protein kinase/Tfp pilus assembly protein PilF
MVGTTLAHYRIEERLGKGGMGEVYVAHDSKLDRKVALKVLPTEVASQPEHRTRFEREARAIATLNHPNIVTIHSVEESGDTSFITMELIRGQTLDELVPKSGFAIGPLLDIAIPLADAVSAAHRSGITHRDLKPQTIMIDGEGRLKVLDFGLAKLKQPTAGDEVVTHALGDGEHRTQEGKILGTAAYMSPEQAEGRPVDPRSDVFSLGIVLFQMATGRRPFQGDSGISVISSILKDPAPELGRVKPAMPRELGRIVRRCLAKDPDRRFQSALELRNQLEDLRQTGGTTRVPRSRALRWAAVAAVAVAMTVLILVVRHGWLSSADPPASTRPTVAVLPFQNLSADLENQYFADGITEEITSKLSRITGLEVASRTSADRFKNSDLDVRVIADELGVRYVLEGSVRRANGRVRITAQLIDAGNGFHVWAEDFDGQLGDVFRLQEETALEIAEALDLRLSPGEQRAVRRRATSNPQAYDAYLRGRALVEYFNIPEKLEAAQAHLERALELDPDYPLALVGLSRVESQYYRNLDPSPERLGRAEELARRALQLDPELAEAHLAMGQVHGNRYEYREAAERFREAIRIEPDSSYAWDLLSWALAYQQPPEAVAAEEAARTSIGLEASLIGAHYHLGRALALQGRYDEAIAAFEHAKSLDPGFDSADFGIAQVHVAQGEYERALARIDGLGELRQTPVVLVQRCFAEVALGRTEEGLAHLEEALASGYRDVAALQASPQLAAVRSDPEFNQLLERFGIAP